MTRAEIFAAITAERARQDEKHPVAFYALMANDANREKISDLAIAFKIINDTQESNKEHNAYNLLSEEFFEFFAETDKARQVEEAIQNAALWVRIIEEITK